MPRRSRLPSLSPLLAALLLLAACDGPTDPARLVVQAVEGNAQEGLPGELLPLDLGARVTHADGSPAEGVAVTFQAADGAGTVQAVSAVTDRYGMARATWQLPPQAGGTLVVTARAAGVEEPARFTAGWLPRERMDLLLTNAASRVRLLLHAPGLMGTATAVPVSFVDSLAMGPLRSAAQAFTEVVAFADGHPPLVRTGLRWTPQRDTLRLEFPARVRVPLTFWIIRRPFEEGRINAEDQVAVAREIWGRAGIDFDVRVVDATAFAGADQYQDEVPACSEGLLSLGRDAGRTNVYFTGQPFSSWIRGGFACDVGTVHMPSMGQIGGTAMLAHELGHTFSLPHDPAVGNVMYPSGGREGPTAGQVFHAHASSYSALQVLYGDRAVVEPRLCFPPGTCVVPGFDL